MIYTKEYIESLSYSDFVGIINQWNVLPGGHSTLSKWGVYSHLNERSKILEIACTTGFSSRELALRFKCKGKAFDLSETAIEMAKLNIRLYTPSVEIDYFQANVHDLELSEKFTHIVVGASLKFIPDSDIVLKKCISWLEDEGFILASPFYIKESIPNELTRRARKVFGITPTIESYKEIMKLYGELEILYEDRCEIVKETDEEINDYCHHTIHRACDILNISNDSVYIAMLERLRSIRNMSNLLRPFQGYSVLVLRHRKSIHPHRYIELF